MDKISSFENFNDIELDIYGQSNSNPIPKNEKKKDYTNNIHTNVNIGEEEEEEDDDDYRMDENLLINESTNTTNDSEEEDGNGHSHNKNLKFKLAGIIQYPWKSNFHQKRNTRRKKKKRRTRGYINSENTDDTGTDEQYLISDENSIYKTDDDDDNENKINKNILAAKAKEKERRKRLIKEINRGINGDADYDDDDNDTIELLGKNGSSDGRYYDDEDDEDDREDDDDNETLSNNDYYIMAQDEIPYINLWSSFSKRFISSILFTSRYNTYQKQTRKRYMVSLLALFGVSFLYLLIAMYIYLMDGYSTHHIHDLNDYSKRSMVFAAIFLMFSTGIGMISLRYKFKPAVTFYILLNILSFGFHFFSVRQIHDSVINSERNIAHAWWDVYTNDVKLNFENKYNCCGYLDYTDNAIPSEHCPEEVVHRRVKPETLGPIPVVKQKNKFNKTFTIPDLIDENGNEHMLQLLKKRKRSEKNIQFELMDIDFESKMFMTSTDEVEENNEKEKEDNKWNNNNNNNENENENKLNSQSKSKSNTNIKSKMNKKIEDKSNIDNSNSNFDRNISNLDIDIIPKSKSKNHNQIKSQIKRKRSNTDSITNKSNGNKDDNNNNKNKNSNNINYNNNKINNHHYRRANKNKNKKLKSNKKIVSASSSSSSSSSTTTQSSNNGKNIINNNMASERSNKTMENINDWIPEGCKNELNKKVSHSLFILCLFCWILTLASPFSLVFSVLYWKTLDITPKSYEYF